MMATGKIVTQGHLARAVAQTAWSFLDECMP